MSQERVVRQQLALKVRSRRTPEELLLVRFRWLGGLSYRLLARLSPTSRLRKRVLLRAYQIGLAAFNRGDLEVVLLPFQPDAEIHPPRELAESLGFQSSYRGPDGYRESYADWRSAWGEFRFQPQELIDLSDRLLVLGQVRLRGHRSGLSLSEEVAVLNTLDGDGKVVKEQRYTSHAAALAAVGLPTQ